MNTGFAIYEFAFGLLKIGYQDDAVVLLKKVDDTDDFGQKTALTDKVYAQVLDYTANVKHLILPINWTVRYFNKKSGRNYCKFPMAKPALINKSPKPSASPTPAEPWAWQIITIPS